MICSACGFENLAGGVFCRQCGTKLVIGGGAQSPWMPMQVPPVYSGAFAPVQRTRLANNLQAVGIMWCIFGVYRLLRGLIVASAVQGMASAGMFGDVPSFFMESFGAMVPFFALTTAVMAVLSVVAGVGLLARKPWARTLAIVLAILSLIKIPFGTALGIYTLWVLAPSAAKEEWARIERS
jgi:hypothetical protein